MNKTHKTPAAAGGSLLVASSQSSRLREMRDKAMAGRAAPAPAQPQHKPVTDHEGFSQEFSLVRQLIDQRLAEILASLPAGKQRSLFKIRFGIELDRIENLPVKRLLTALKISHPQLNNPRGVMKQVLELAYNGGPVL